MRNFLAEKKKQKRGKLPNLRSLENAFLAAVSRIYVVYPKRVILCVTFKPPPRPPLVAHNTPANQANEKKARRPFLIILLFIVVVVVGISLGPLAPPPPMIFFARSNSCATGETR